MQNDTQWRRRIWTWNQCGFLYGNAPKTGLVSWCHHPDRPHRSYSIKTLLLYLVRDAIRFHCGWLKACLAVDQPAFSLLKLPDTRHLLSFSFQFLWQFHIKYQLKSCLIKASKNRVFALHFHTGSYHADVNEADAFDCCIIADRDDRLVRTFYSALMGR